MLARIGTEVRHLATKADLEAKLSSQFRRFIGVMVTVNGLTVSLVFLIARYTGT